MFIFLVTPPHHFLKKIIMRMHSSHESRHDNIECFILAASDVAKDGQGVPDPSNLSVGPHEVRREKQAIDVLNVS